MSLRTPVYNLKNEEVDSMELPETVFGAKWNPILVAQVLRAARANLRRPWAHAKGRGEVRGGGKKPWRQKGTGRARHGSIRSPLWVGGGKSHGPLKSRSYAQRIPKKMRRTSLCSALSKKLRDKEVKIFDVLEVQAPKTKTLHEILHPLLHVPPKKKLDVLLVTDKENKNIARASSNLPTVHAVPADFLSLEDVLRHKHVFIDRNAVHALARHCGQK